MEKKIGKKFCPLTFKLLKDGLDIHVCIKEKCAWWVPYTDCGDSALDQKGNCAIVASKDVLNSIEQGVNSH